MSNEEFRRFQKEGWERVARRYEPAWGTLTSLFLGPLVDRCEVSAGNRVLDVACGPGYAAGEAARRGARVVGIDISLCMTREALDRHPGLSFVQGDAERLAFHAAAFDTVMMNFGILHLADADRALTEARRVLRPAGRYVFTVWARPEQNPARRIVSDAIEAHADMSVPLPEGPQPLRFADPVECRRSLDAAGFDDSSVRFDTHRRDWIVPTPGFLFDAEMNAGVRTAGLLALQPPERLERIRAAIEDEVRGFACPAGYALPMTAHVVSAVRS